MRPAWTSRRCREVTCPASRLAMADVSYVPGGRTAIAGDSCWALIDAAPDSAVVAEIWRRMSLNGPSSQELREQVPGALLQALIAGVMQFGFAHMPDFVL